MQNDNERDNDLDNIENRLERISNNLNHMPLKKYDEVVLSAMPFNKIKRLLIKQ